MVSEQGDAAQIRTLRGEYFGLGHGVAVIGRQKEKTETKRGQEAVSRWWLM